MLLSRFGGFGRYEPKVLFAPDGGDNGGGGAGGDDDGGTATISKEEHQKEIERLQKKFDNSSAELRRLSQSKEKELKAELEKTTDRLKELEKLTQGDLDDNDLPPKIKGKIEVIRDGFNKQYSELKTRFEESQKALEEEHKRRLEVERDRQLSDALQAAGCRDNVGGRRYFVPDIEFDDDSKTWMLRTQQGNLVSIADGVQAGLPDYLKDPATVGGGSGASGGTVKAATSQKQLELLDKEIQTLQKEMETSPNSDSLAAKVLQKIRDRDSLKKKLASTK